MVQKHVIILGGGVAGMSAAHELIERGFRVTVFENQKLWPGGGDSGSMGTVESLF